MHDGWHRFRVRDVCPVCGHGGRAGHGSGCAYTGTAEKPELVLCLRTDTGSFKEARDGHGWIHRVSGEPQPRRIAPPQPPRTPEARMRDLSIAFRESLTAAQLAEHAGTLGVSVESLQRLSAGWCDHYLREDGSIRRTEALAFPMRGADGQVIGIRLRNDKGQKWAVPGSFNGLFVPKRNRPDGPLFIVEGPTETAAMIDMGFATIGRPGNTAGCELLVAFAKRFLPRRHVIIFRNNDPQGSDALRLTLLGASKLAAELMAANAAKYVSIIVPPETKDVRDWKKKGCTSADIWRLVDEIGGMAA